jgi:hypothetical protein
MVKKLNKILSFLIFCCAPVLINAQNPALNIPTEVQEFIETDAAPIALEKADLNGDGRTDFLVVTERARIAGEESPGDQRLLFILLRGTDGKLKPGDRSEMVVYCKSCGGVMGDPFAGVEVRRGSFIVNNYGGSNLRWSESYQFDYSRRDKTWQLVRAVSETFNALEPKKMKTKILTSKNFGKINLADFDPARLEKFK